VTGLRRQRRREAGAAAVIAVLAGMLAACAGGPVGTAARPAPAAQAGKKPIWMLTRYALGQVAADPAVRAGLRRSSVYQLLRPGQQPRPWAGSAAVVTFPAAGALRQAVTGGRLPPGARAVLYDPEAWPLTPVTEQRDPAGAAAEARAAAKGHGLALIVAPALNLTTLRGGGPGARWQRFLRSHLAAAVAAVADIVALQAQSLERDAAVYERFVREAAAQARAANPHVRILAGLSTNPPGGPVTSGQLVTAIRAVRGMVDGYWLNIPGRGPRCPACGPPRPAIGRAVLAAVLPVT
jgi:hypothetical protein